MPSTSPTARRRAIKWKFDPGTDRAWAGDVACCGVNNRGVALWKDKVISISLDGRLFSLNKATGEMVWERKVADPADRRDAHAGPAGRPRYRHRRRRRRRVRHPRLDRRRPTSTPASRSGAPTPSPAPGEPGNETWKDGKERWKHGGGSVWETATYDPETDTFYQGIGNAGPDWDPEYRPGDNKWAASVLALSPSDGKIKWGYQYTPNDPYDFDEISEHPIINAKVNGEDRKLVVHAARNGFYYALDRTNGSFVTGKQYVDQLNWTTGLDPKTGRPLNYNPNTDVQEYAPGSHSSRAQAQERPPVPVAFRRQELGARRLQSRAQAALHPLDRGLQLLETVEQKDFVDQGGPVKPRERFAGGGRQADRASLRQPQGARSHHRRDQGQAEARISELQRRARDRRQPGVPRPLRRHVLGPRRQDPAGGLELQRRHRHQCAADHLSVNGKQYIAVLVGSRNPLNVWQNAPELKNAATASMLYVFEL